MSLSSVSKVLRMRPADKELSGSASMGKKYVAGSWTLSFWRDDTEDEGQLRKFAGQSETTSTSERRASTSNDSHET